MRRLAFCASLFAAVIAAGCTRAAPPQPNVLLIVVDTLRADHLGCYGYARPTSPRLDALAATGVRFAAARATSSWTAPSVASILTGLYPVKHGLQLPRERLRPDTPLLAEQFQRAGYATGAYSANPAFVSPRQGFNRGIEEFYSLHGGASDGGDPDVMPGAGAGAGDIKVANAAAVTAAALEWVARADATKPAFLYVHYFDPHEGYFPPQAYAERFGVAADSPLRTSQQARVLDGTPDAAQLATLEALYDAEIAFTDAQIGRLLDTLPKVRPWVVVVTADHGEEFLEHGGLRHSRTLFDEVLQVPLIIAGTGVSPGKVIARPVSIADLWPTLAAVAGLEAPAALDGISLAAALEAGVEPPPRAIFADMRRANAIQVVLHRHAVVDGSWKLLENMDESLALFALATDPREQRDRLPAEEARAAPLRSALAQHDAPSAPAPTVALSEQDRERMRALGYDVH